MQKRAGSVALAASLALAILSGGCGSSTSGSAPETKAAPVGYAIVSAGGAPLQLVAGDTAKLKVVRMMPDGTTADLAAGASVTWISPPTIDALAPDATGTSPLPAGPQSGIAFVRNPARPDGDDSRTGTAFVFDPGVIGNVDLVAMVDGTEVRTTVQVAPPLTGDPARGGTLYAANCALCHGSTGHGSPPAPGTDAGGATPAYLVGGQIYAFPAPGLNAEDGNVARDPAWNAALFAVAARGDFDNAGVALRQPMPDWLTADQGTGSVPPTTQDFADIYAFLRTQTR